MLSSGPLSLWERVRVRGNCHGMSKTFPLTPALSQREREILKWPLSRSGPPSKPLAEPAPRRPIYNSLGWQGAFVMRKEGRFCDCISWVPSGKSPGRDTCWRPPGRGFSSIAGCSRSMITSNATGSRAPLPRGGSPRAFLTHAHVDHCGLLPRLVHDGFHGSIYATPATSDLAELILYDAAQIQVEDAAFKRKRPSQRRTPRPTSRAPPVHRQRGPQDRPVVRGSSLRRADSRHRRHPRLFS